MCFTIVGWGALTDIGASLTSLRMVRRTQELEEAYSQLEDLNREMRAQRHDFLNHLQVVYSLLEMQEYGEATAYLERVYDEHRSVSSVLRTKMTAFNALLQVKSAACEERGIALEMDIRSTLEGLPVPPWELCCIIGNLFDNAIDASMKLPPEQRRVQVMAQMLSPAMLGLVVENRYDGMLKKQQGILRSTKHEGTGIGLVSAETVVHKYNGNLHLETEEQIFRVNVLLNL